MNIEKYLRSVRRRLNMPKALKDRVMTDFRSSVEARLEDGQSIETILAELGSPRDAAAELNRQMQEYTYKKSPWRWVCLLLAAVSGFRLIRHWSAGILMMIFGRPRHGADIGIIGGADGPTAIFVTTSPDVFLYRFALYGLLLILSIIGFIALGKLKRK